ncbi:hypothetical protein J6590_050855 [Homalodisca vitripennis]|nr:hypothetical protein J6590_050855 [Homalodisca vitripennis]
MKKGGRKDTTRIWKKSAFDNYVLTMQAPESAVLALIYLGHVRHFKAMACPSVYIYLSHEIRSVTSKNNLCLEIIPNYNT